MASPAELNSWSHLPTGFAILAFSEEESLMSRIGDLFKGSQVFRNQQLGHFLLHYSPLTHALLKTEYGPNSLPRRLNLSIDTCWRLWERVSRVSEGDLSFHTVSRRHGSDWEPVTWEGKALVGLVRTAEPLAGLALAPPQDGSAKCQSAPCWRRKVERDMDVLPLCLPTWVCRMQWQRYS